jgi:hypothetical protein
MSASSTHDQLPARDADGYRLLWGYAKFREPGVDVGESLRWFPAAAALVPDLGQRHHR